MSRSFAILINRRMLVITSARKIRGEKKRKKNVYVNTLHVNSKKKKTRGEERKKKKKKKESSTVSP